MRTKMLTAAVVVIGLFGAFAAEAVILRTSADTIAHQCCLPNGFSVTTIDVAFLVQVLEAEPIVQATGTVTWAQRTNSKCDFSGSDFFEQGGSIVVDRENVSFPTTEMFTDQLVCPFGARSESIAVLSGSFPSLAVVAFSECAQPCFECEPAIPPW